MTFLHAEPQTLVPRSNEVRTWSNASRRRVRRRRRALVRSVPAQPEYQQHLHGQSDETGELSHQHGHSEWPRSRRCSKRDPAAAQRRSNEDPGAKLVPVGGDDDDLVGVQVTGGCGHGDGVLDRRAGGGVAEKRHLRTSPRRAHQLGFAAATRPPGPAGKNDRASTRRQLLGASQAHYTDRIQDIGAPAGVTEYRDDANRISHDRSGVAHGRTRTASRSP